MVSSNIVIYTLYIFENLGLHIPYREKVSIGKTFMVFAVSSFTVNVSP